MHTHKHTQTNTDRWTPAHTDTDTHTLGSGSHGCRQRLCERFLMSYLAYLPENYCRGPFIHLFAQDDRLISYLCSIQNICFSMVRSRELNIYSAWKQRRLPPPQQCLQDALCSAECSHCSGCYASFTIQICRFTKGHRRWVLLFYSHLPTIDLRVWKGPKTPLETHNNNKTTTFPLLRTL